MIYKISHLFDLKLCKNETVKLRFSAEYDKLFTALHLYNYIRCCLDLHCCFVVAVFALLLVCAFVVLALNISLLAMRYDLEEKLGHKEDDLDAADDRKPREEPHRSSNETHLYVFKSK